MARADPASVLRASRLWFSSLRCLFDARIRTDPFELLEYCRATLTHFFWKRTLKN
jgi:hypothetical protein